MILAVSIREDKILLAARDSVGSEPSFHQFEVPEDFFDEKFEPGAIWEWAEEEISTLYARADNIVLGLPASNCLVKLFEIDCIQDKANTDYRHWKAHVQLPGPLSDYEYGYLSIGKSFDGTKEESIFFAVPAERARLYKSAFVDEGFKGTVTFVPENAAFTELIKRSIDKEDIFQAAAAHFEKSYCLVVFLRDNRFFGTRVFNTEGVDPADTAVEIQTFLLSMAVSDEACPLIITGKTEYAKLSWTPTVTPFLDIKNYDYCVVWGLSELAVIGGLCESSAEN